MATEAPVTEGRILDLIADACTRYKQEGQRGIDWTFHMSMSAREKLAFDIFLVRTGDELAWEAGTVEHRFTTRVRRMVEATR